MGVTTVPEVNCSKCGRKMALITNLTEDGKKYIVECPVCGAGTREVKTVE